MFTGCLPPKVGFKRSALNMGEIRCLSLMDKGFPNGGLVGKISWVIGAEHKNNKLVIMAS